MADSVQQAEKKSMSIDIQQMKAEINQKGGNTPNSQAADSSRNDSPLKPKSIRPRSIREGHSSLSRKNVEESQVSPRSPESNTGKRRRDQEGKKQEVRPFDMDQASLTQNPEFISAQRSNLEHVHRLDRRIDETLDRLAEVFHKIDRIAGEVRRLSDWDPNQKLDQLKRRMIEAVVHEHLAPLKRNLNVDLKRLRRHVEECLATTEDHQERHLNVQQQLDLINVTILRQLKNTDNEKQLLNRELNRMQHIDRVKVHNARTSFYNPDTGGLLPTVDTLYAATSVQSPSLTGDLASFDVGAPKTQT